MEASVPVSVCPCPSPALSGLIFSRCFPNNWTFSHTNCRSCPQVQIIWTLTVCTLAKSTRTNTHCPHSSTCPPLLPRWTPPMPSGADKPLPLLPSLLVSVWTCRRRCFRSDCSSDRFVTETFYFLHHFKKPFKPGLELDYIMKPSTPRCFHWLLRSIRPLAVYSPKLKTKHHLCLCWNNNSLV